MSRVTYVMIHGAPGNGSVFRPLIEAVPSHSSAVTWDAPDHGESPDAPETTPADHINALEHVVRAIGTPVALVGHSYGGWLASQLASRGLPNVVRLVVIGGFAYLPEDVGAALRGAADALASGSLPKRAFVDAGLASWLGGNRTAEGELLLRGCLEPESPVRMARALRRAASITAEKAATLSAVQIPALSIHCTRDAAVPLSLGEDLSMRIRSRLESIDDAGHFPWLTHLDVVRKLVYV